jgi:DNA (cytosine-5)-methyltransferase 1
MRICSLFTGIGGFEIGLGESGFETTVACEIDEAAQAVIETHFPGVHIHADISRMKRLPDCDVVTAGWPCQDLSQAGKMAGLDGNRSSLINHLFRLLRRTRNRPEYILLENVAFSLHLQRGTAIQHVVNELQSLGYKWAYRILNTLEFGLPQRRRRIFIVASRTHDPSTILFNGQASKPLEEEPSCVGFYWTEGNRGIGWTANAVPPLKGGSSFSIPSPPAIWNRRAKNFCVPSITDAERMQGFKANWTAPAAELGGRQSVRWRLVGNAVSTPVARWIGKRIMAQVSGDLRIVKLPQEGSILRHNFAWGGPREPTRYARLEVEGPARPIRPTTIERFLHVPPPLSLRAAAGFLRRLSESTLRVKPDFIADLTNYAGMPTLPSKAA